MKQPSTAVPAVKDPDGSHPIASACRPTLRSVVKAFARGAFELGVRPTEVDPLEPGVAEQIREFVADYGETLVELGEECWETSVAQWMEGHWDILVDLSTAESGDSDLVLHARVVETADGFRFAITSVHVP